MKLSGSCKHPRHEQKDIICLVTSGILPIVVKKNFLLKFAKDTVLYAVYRFFWIQKPLPLKT